MGYYERYIDRLINANYKNYHQSIDKARKYAVKLIDMEINILETLKSKNIELTEKEKSFEQAYCLFKTEENYIKHKKEKENKIMDKEVKKVKTVGDGVKFDRIRRITGYLVGTLDRFNNAKKAEVTDRVTHATK